MVQAVILSVNIVHIRGTVRCSDAASAQRDRTDLVCLLFGLTVLKLLAICERSCEKEPDGNLIFFFFFNNFKSLVFYLPFGSRIFLSGQV